MDIGNSFDGFQTRIIEKKKNPRARVATVGVVLFMAGMLLSVVHGYEQYALWSFGAGMVLLIGGAVYAKGNLSNIGVSDTDVVVNVSSIRIWDMTYPIDQIAGLEFLVEGYDGMVIPGTRASRRTFLFEAVTDAQWEELMIENGYR